jgi:hypothetical protein
VARTIPVYLEVGTKRVFAGAIDWPGWSRSGRNEDAAMQALAEYGPRYAAAMGSGATGQLRPPADRSALHVVERLDGDATTDFGAPAAQPSHDRQPLTAAELKRQIAVLEASWKAFARAARAAAGVPLTKGPRGGGRDLDAIVRHVLEAEGSYLYRLGRSYRPEEAHDVARALQLLRKQILDVLRARVRGEPLPPSKRTAPLWPPRSFVRRTAWHALDHAWELEDRSRPEG